MTMIDEARQCLDALSQAVTDSGNLDLLVWGKLPNQWSAFWLATCGGPALLTAIDTAAARISAQQAVVDAARRYQQAHWYYDADHSESVQELEDANNALCATFAALVPDGATDDRE